MVSKPQTLTGFAPISEIRRLRDNVNWGKLKFRERDFETYFEETPEWQEEAQLHYGNIKHDIERQISLGIGFVGLGEGN